MSTFSEYGTRFTLLPQNEDRQFDPGYIDSILVYNSKIDRYQQSGSLEDLRKFESFQRNVPDLVDHFVVRYVRIVEETGRKTSAEEEQKFRSFVHDHFDSSAIRAFRQVMGRARSLDVSTAEGMEEAEVLGEQARRYVAQGVPKNKRGYLPTKTADGFEYAETLDQRKGSSRMHRAA